MCYNLCEDFTFTIVDYLDLYHETIFAKRECLNKFIDNSY